MTSTIGVTVLLCDCEERLVEVGAFDFFHDPVGRGEFGVESDRERLALPCAQLLESRLRSFLASGDTRGYIRLMSWSPRVMDGLSKWLPNMLWDMDQRLEDLGPAACFLRMMHIEKVAERVHGTWPLLLATAMGNTAAMEDLLQCRADIACREARHDPLYRVFKGESAVHIAAESGHVGALALLVERGADLQALGAFGTMAMHWIGYAGSDATEAVGAFLLEHRADIDTRNSLNCTALELTALYDRAEAVEFLLSHGAATECNDEGQNALHLATLLAARPEIVNLLVDAGVSPCDRLYPRWGRQLWLMMTLLGLNYRLGRRGFATLCGHHIWGATPLMTAAMAVDPEAAEILLRARADPEARNIRGATASTLAEIFGASKGVSIHVASFFGSNTPQSP